MTEVRVAVAWLRKEDWQRWSAIDKQLPPYERWLAKVTAAIDQAKASGLTAVKIDVDPDRFVEWCRANHKPIDRDSRALFASAELAKRRDAN